MYSNIAIPSCPDNGGWISDRGKRKWRSPNLRACQRTADGEKIQNTLLSSCFSHKIRVKAFLSCTVCDSHSPWIVPCRQHTHPPPPVDTCAITVTHIPSCAHIVYSYDSRHFDWRRRWARTCNIEFGYVTTRHRTLKYGTTDFGRRILKRLELRIVQWKQSFWG